MLENLKEYREQLEKLNKEEKKQRDLYLRKLSLGEIQGPLTGYASIDKPWLKYFPTEGIIADIPKVSAYDFVYEKMKNKSECTAFNYMGNKISYETFFGKTTQVAKSLKKIGINKGDFVTLALPTCPETIYILYALNRIGAISNFIDPRLKSNDFIKSMKRTSSKNLICADICIPTIMQVNEEYNIENTVVLSPLESAPEEIKNNPNFGYKKIDSESFINWENFLQLGKNYDDKIDVKFESNTPVAVVYTGGTTGEPKGVLLTNENFNSMAIAQDLSGLGINIRDTFLTFLPPFIAYCIVNSIHDPLYLGCENILLPTFEPKSFPKLINTYKPNHVLAGPILWDFLIKDEEIQKEDLSFLKSPVSGGDVLNSELEKAINKFFEEHNLKYKIAQGYGMTEVSSAATYSLQNSYCFKSVGIPYFKNNVAIIDIDTEEELSYNQEGQVIISAPTMMKEYLNNKEATDDIIKEINGVRWIKTGDLGYIDSDGHLFIQGRIKRLIVRNGNKIFPKNIEELIRKTGLVDLCAVVQMDDEKERHVPVATIVLKEEMIGQEELVVEKLDEYIRANMPEFNVPSKYIVTDELPLTDINKINFKYIEKNIEEYSGIPDRIIKHKFSKPKTLQKSINE